MAREVYRIMVLPTAGHHDLLGAVCERHCGAGYGLALDYKSVTLGEPALR
jgi:hypothetical protein